MRLPTDASPLVTGRLDQGDGRRGGVRERSGESDWEWEGDFGLESVTSR